MVAECQRRLMGSNAHIVVSASTGRRTEADLLNWAFERLDQLEARWSRFRPDSEVSRLNQLGTIDPDAVAASQDTRLLLQRAELAHRLTNKRFNPYRLGSLTAAGYDVHYALQQDRISAAPAAGRLPNPAPGAGFDPGGIGKGLAADLVAEELVELGATGALVNLGGDLRVIGEAPGGAAWRIDVDDPEDGQSLATVELFSGAVATSSTRKRRWTLPDGTARHHLIDPETHTSSTSRVRSVTVIAAQGWQAEVLCKPLLLDWHAGPAAAHPDPAELIERVGAAALVNLDHLRIPSRNWERFAVRSAAAA